MSLESNAIQWVSGYGWLILASDGDDRIRARAISRAMGGADVAYISYAHDEGDSLLADMEDLGAPPGFSIDLRQDSIEVIEELLKQAALIVLESGQTTDDVYADLLQSGAIDLLLAAYQRGAVILIEGVCASLFGTWFVADDRQLQEGFGWISDMFVLHGISDSQKSEVVSSLLTMEPRAATIALGSGTAVVFGGSGQIEVWGDANAAITFGEQFHQE